MNQTDTLFCKCIRLSLHPEELPSFTEADCSYIAKHHGDCRTLAEKHSLVSSFYESLCLLEIPLAPEEQKYYRQRVTGNALGVYHMLSFTRKILSILEREHITYFLLKGATLLECYPTFECRSFGDVDILVPNKKEFDSLKNLLLTQGFFTENSFAEHHLEMYYPAQEKTLLLEIHHKVIARQANPEFNRQIKEIFHHLPSQTGIFLPASLSYQMFPVTENALYLLLHMLQHFLGSGFGIRLLCDWTVYLEKHGAEIQKQQFLSYLEQLGITKFCHAMTALCHDYLGLDTKNFPFLTDDSMDKSYLDSLMEDIIEGGTFGKSNRNRMLIMSTGGKFTQYFIELHRQMKRRFQKSHKILPLIPFLWVITAGCFLWNNFFLRRTKTRDILATARKRQNLIKKLSLFEKGGNTHEK